MKFYLDFEAARFSNHIINIGCVAENGATFETLIKPGGKKKKIDKFITDLTGITNEMLSGAPDADTAFKMLYNFIENNNNDEAPIYYVYGSSDAEFINSTLRYMSDTQACVCAQAIAGNLIDYASVVKEFFVAKSDLALRKVYMLIQEQKELVQKHDALEDARMLETVVAHLHDKCKPEDKETILAMPSQPRFKPKTNNKKAPEIFLKWNNINKWEAETGANENCWVLKCIDQHCGKIMYFNDFTTAALWVIKYSARNVSPKNASAVKKIEDILKAAHQNNKSRYGCIWEYNPEGAIMCMSKENENE